MLVRDPNTDLLHKTTDDSWPRCQCGRCVYEDMEFPIYYGTGPDDPHVRKFVAEGRAKGRNSDISEEQNIESTLAFGIGTYECFECGNVWHWRRREWVAWEEPDIEFEITHYYRPLNLPSEREDSWRPLMFVTRQVGTEGPLFSEFCTWTEMTPEHVADHVRTDWAIPFAEAVPVQRGATLWMAAAGGLWLSPTEDPEQSVNLDAEE